MILQFEGDPMFPKSFDNEPATDFAQQASRDAMRAALDQVAKQFGRRYVPIIDGQPIETANAIESVNPSRHAQVIGIVSQAGREEARRAVEAAARGWPAWRAKTAAERAGYLRRAADIMRRRRFELAAWIVYESGKTWREADADVSEAIDFFEYYALGAVALEVEQGCDVPGEQNRFVYAPRGVAAVIAPWNFPLAILAGMTAAALATGNTAIIKPAEQTPVIAAKLMEVLAEAGFPVSVVHYLPGSGESAGAELVENPAVSLIAFTGSRAVGLWINRRAAEVSAQGAPMVKRVIAEMGGKNGLIIDDDADLDEAVEGVVDSAFGYQGQKCSACSRAIVIDKVHEAFVKRLIEATRSLKVGPADEPSTSVGPVIDAEALGKIQRYCEIGRGEAREALAVDVGALAEQGYFVGPRIFVDVAPHCRIAQEEIFGPVLAVLRAKNLDDAIEIANGTDYALTGGVFSRSPKTLRRVRSELQVGNLYINRAITGAIVARQPFGGYKMSGIGSKAGGPDYLLQYVVPRTITENTMRRGFAPAED
jgi:RHH-type proline utilization regulon transcriptional repressor/proline dehydrogenase/delta 1-pyrroline-5-carboxylate dehydrogenase